MAYNEEVTMMMSVVPGSLTGISAMMGGLASITNVFTDITRQVDATFGLIDTSIITASTIVAQFAVDAAKAAGEFEQGLKVAQMVSGQTAQEMDYLRNKANELSVSFRTDIDQITEGLQTLGRAGLNSAAEQTEVLENGLSTAKLEGRDLNGVLEELIQNTALLGGNLKSSSFGEDSQYVNDLLVATSMTAPITTHDVSETLKYSGGIAAAAGARIDSEEGKAILEDYMGAIAAFAQKGVTGSIAGTALRAFFNKPATQDSSVTEALASIHLKPEYLWEDGEEKMKPVSEQIKIIKNQMEELNVSTMDQLQIWSKIVGGKMGQQMMKLDADDIEKLTSDIRKADDAGSLAAGTFQTFQAKMKEMTEQGQVAFRQFGEYAAAYLTPLLEVLKRIFEFFSNPVVSFVGFIGALSLITAAVSRIKNLFSLLKSEMQLFHDFFTRGDKLMAVRPSTVRKNNRFQKEELEKKYPGQSYGMAYSKERVLEEEEKLKEQGYSYAQIDMMRKSATMGKSFVNNKSFRFKKEELFPHLNDEELKELKDSAVIEALINPKNKLWDKKYEETYYKYGRNLNKVLEVWGDEINEKLHSHYNKKHQEDLDRMNRLRKESTSKVSETPITRKEKGKYLAEFHNQNIKDIQKRRDELNKTLFSSLDDIEAFPVGTMNAEIHRKFTNLEKQGKTESGNNVPFNIARSSTTKDYINKYIERIEEAIGPIGWYMGKDNEGYKDVYDALSRRTMLPKDRTLSYKIKDALRERGINQNTKEMDKYIAKFTKGRDTDLLNVALLSRQDFQKTIGSSLPIGISYDQLQKYMLESKGLYTVSDVVNKIKPRRGIYESHELPNLLGYEDLVSLYGSQAVSFSKAADEDFMEYDPYKAADKAEERRLKEKRAEQRREMIQRQSEVINSLYSKHYDYYTKDELMMKHNSKQLDKPYLSKSQIQDIMKQYYGRTVKGTRNEVIDYSAPFLSDWKTMTAGELKNFATRELHIDEKHLKSNKVDTLINQINQRLSTPKILQIEKEIVKLEKERKQHAAEIIAFYEKENELLEEQHRKILKTLEKGRTPKPSEPKQPEPPKTKPEPTSTPYGDVHYYSKANKEHSDSFRERLDDIRKRNTVQNSIPISNEVFESNTKENKNTKSFQNDVNNHLSQIEKQLSQNSNFVEKQKEAKRQELREKYKDKKVGPNVGFAQDVDDDLLRKALGEYGHGLGYHGYDNIHSDDYYKAKGAEILKENEEVLKRIIPNYDGQFKNGYPVSVPSQYTSPTIMGNQVLSNEVIKKGFLSRLSNANIGNRILDSLFTVGHNSLFGTVGARNTLTKGQKLGNMFQNVTNLLGGPFMFALEAVTAVIQQVQQAYQNYIESLKQAEEQVTQAFSKVNSAESSLRRAYEEQNPDASSDEIDDMVYETYGTMAEDMNKAIKENDKAYFEKLNLDAAKEKELEYDEEKDDGSLKQVEEEEKTAEEAHEEAIKENTGALYEATAQLNVATSKLANEMLADHWGMDSGETWFSDSLGDYFDNFFDDDNFYDRNADYPNTFGTDLARHLGDTFSTNGGEFLLTDSQKDKNYPGYSEMAGLMLENIKDYRGNWIAGMRVMMGNDVDLLNKMIPKRSQEWMKTLSMSQRGGIGSMDARTNAKFQTSMKNDSKTWKKLAREYAKRDVNAKQGRDTSKNVKRIKNLTQKLSGQVGSGFKSNHAMQAAYLVQMQEMYKVAQNTMVPLIDENTQLAGNQLLTQAGIQSSTGNTADNAGGTWGTAEIISGLVAIIAKTKAAEYAYQTAQEADPGEVDASGNITRKGTDLNGDGFDKDDRAIIELAQKTDSAQAFQKEANSRYYQGRNYVHLDGNQDRDLMAPALFIAQMYGAGAKMTGYDYDAKTANETMQKWIKNDLTGKESLSDIYGTLGKNYTENEKFHQRLIDNYINATGEDEGSNSGGGGGDGGGGDSGDKDNTGTKKERVDLVLCNKKEIPKLNVNLFKKPPTFTVLNKNFKLRDVKINTQDKPKAIMASIKNAFIDVQKRSDPKIIQDEEAEYDPVGATDGNSVPSGSSTAKTDSKKSNN